MMQIPDSSRWEGAVAVVRFHDGFTMLRPAAFVFVTSKGRVAWVESSYADPHGAGSPALHFATGVRADPSGRGIKADNGSWSVTLLPYDSEDPADEDARLAFEWFAGWLREQGRTWAEERVRVLAMIENELA